MTESSPNAAVLNALIEIEIRLQRIFEAIDAQDTKIGDLGNLIRIVADREY